MLVDAVAVPPALAGLRRFALDGAAERCAGDLADGGAVVKLVEHEYPERLVATAEE